MEKYVYQLGLRVLLHAKAVNRNVTGFAAHASAVSDRFIDENHAMSSPNSKIILHR